MRNNSFEFWDPSIRSGLRQLLFRLKKPCFLQGLSSLWADFFRVRWPFPCYFLFACPWCSFAYSIILRLPVRTTQFRFFRLHFLFSTFLVWFLTSSVKSKIQTCLNLRLFTECLPLYTRTSCHLIVSFYWEPCTLQEKAIFLRKKKQREEQRQSRAVSSTQKSQTFSAQLQRTKHQQRRKDWWPLNFKCKTHTKKEKKYA